MLTFSFVVTVKTRYDEYSNSWDWVTTNGNGSDSSFDTEAEALADAKRYFS